MMPSNPLQYPRWIRLSEDAQPVLVQNHHHHSAMAGQEYDADAQLVVAAPPDDDPKRDAELPQTNPSLDPFLTTEEEEAAIAAAAGIPSVSVVDEPHIPSEEEAEDLGRPAEEEDASRLTPVDEEDLSEMFAKPIPEVTAINEADEEPKAKRTRKVKE